MDISLSTPGRTVMDFTKDFLAEVRLKRTQLLSLLGRGESSKIESKLRRKLCSHWHDLPRMESSESSGLREFAVDSSSAIRSLANGTDLFIVRGLMLGSDGSRWPRLVLEARRGITDPDLASKFERILRDLIEIEIVVEKGPELNGDIVLIDGNLYGRYTHLMQQINIKGKEYLPLLLFDAMQKMFDACEKRGILVVGISKFSKTRVLSKALLQELGYPMETLDIPDVEMLYKWKDGEKGFTTPLILGKYAFRDEARYGAMSYGPEQYLHRYFHSLPRNRWKWGVEVIRKVPMAPAIVMFHMIPKVGEQPLRIDVPVNCLGLEDRIADVPLFEFADPEIIEGVLSQLLVDRGGRDVYNALLYVVDRKVKLSPHVVDTVYKSILSSELNMPIEYDRSTRRFYR